MHLFTSKTLSNYKKPQIRGVQEGEGGSGEWGGGMDKNFLQGKIHYWMSSQTLFGGEMSTFFFFFFENVHYCKCSWLKEYWTYCNNKSILLGFFFFLPSKQTCPNVTEGVRNASPQRLRSLLQPKHFPANRLQANSGVCLDLGCFFPCKIYTDSTWRMKNKKSIKKIVANLMVFFSRFYHFSFFFFVVVVVTLWNTLWCIYFHCCP